MFRFLVSKLLLFFMRFSMFQDSSGQKNPQKNLVSGNAGYKDNLYVGYGKFIFFNQFSGDIFFSSLVSFVFFVFLLLLLFFACLDFEIDNMYSNAHSAMWVGE